MAVAPEAETFAIPDGMGFDEAGAFPVSYISSHVAMRWQGRLLIRLRPCVTHRLSLERSVEAIRLLTNRKAHRKVVVMPELS